VDTPEPALIKLGFSLEEIPQLKLYGPNGCDRCKEGYKGRTGIFEILEVSPTVSTIILNGGNPIDIYKQAVSEGMWDLRKSGLEKVKAGVTSIEELYRITKD